MDEQRADDLWRRFTDVDAAAKRGHGIGFEEDAAFREALERKFPVASGLAAPKHHISGTNEQEDSRRINREPSAARPLDLKSTVVKGTQSSELSAGGGDPESIPGYDEMTPVERVKARLKLASKKAQSATRDSDRGWTRFVFNKHSALEGDVAGEQPPDESAVKLGTMYALDASDLQEADRLLRDSGNRAAKSQQDHDAAIFGAAPDAGRRDGGAVCPPAKDWRDAGVARDDESHRGHGGRREERRERDRERHEDRHRRERDHRSRRRRSRSRSRSRSRERDRRRDDRRRDDRGREASRRRSRSRSRDRGREDRERDGRGRAHKDRDRGNQDRSSRRGRSPREGRRDDAGAKATTIADASAARGADATADEAVRKPSKVTDSKAPPHGSAEDADVRAAQHALDVKIPDGAVVELDASLWPDKAVDTACPVVHDDLDADLALQLNSKKGSWRQRINVPAGS